MSMCNNASWFIFILFCNTFSFRRSKYLTYRIITVPRKIHETLRGEEGPDALEYEGKNVGIRFARGEFIVSTNQGMSFFFI